MNPTQVLDGIRAGDTLGRVKVFAGKDFHLWKFLFLTYAEAEEVVGYFDRTEVKPIEGASTEELKKCRKGDDLSRIILLTALDYIQMQLLTNCSCWNPRLLIG